jgi:hypothetical protein
MVVVIPPPWQVTLHARPAGQATPASPLGAPLELPELVELGNEPLLLPLLPKPPLVPPLPLLPPLPPLTPPSSNPLCPFFAPHPAIAARKRAHATTAVDSPATRHMIQPPSANSNNALMAYSHNPRI